MQQFQIFKHIIRQIAQWPSGYDKYWTTFLGQETGFLNGAERIAKMMNFPVFYCELSKKRRGYCEATEEKYGAYHIRSNLKLQLKLS